eukprot:7525373-Alexandrium_andersonii.AAC.1
MPHPAACCTGAHGKSRTQQAAVQVPEADPTRAVSHRCPTARGAHAPQGRPASGALRNGS